MTIQIDWRFKLSSLAIIRLRKDFESHHRERNIEEYHDRSLYKEFTGIQK